MSDFVRLPRIKRRKPRARHVLQPFQDGRRAAERYVDGFDDPNLPGAIPLDACYPG
jgi:hypothetical protein